MVQARKLEPSIIIWNLLILSGLTDIRSLPDYRCQTCEKRFARSDHLAKHLKVHRRDRLYTYLSKMGYGTPSRRGRLSHTILNNEAVRSFIKEHNIDL